MPEGDGPGTVKRKRVFRRSPHVVCFWNRDDLILYNYAAGTELVASSELCAIVDACDVPRTAAAILPRCPSIEARHLRDLLALLVEFKMLYRGPLPAAERTMASLGAWNPEVGFFHQRTQKRPVSPTASKDPNISTLTRAEIQCRRRSNGSRRRNPCGSRTPCRPRSFRAYCSSGEHGEGSAANQCR